MRPRVLIAPMDLFVSTEEDYCREGMRFATCRSGKYHYLCYKFPFQCSSSLGQTLRRFC